jgi:hypothetical protein
MKTASERPSLWHVIVTLMAMLYLFSLSKALSSALHSAGNNFTYHDPTVSALCAVFVILEVLAWFFLVADLIRQIALFFGIKFK